MCHPAGVDLPRQPVEMGQAESTLDAELATRTSVGLTGAIVPQLYGVIKKPGDVDGRRAEAKGQAHQLTGTLEQGG